QHVRVRLALEPGIRDAAVPVESEYHLRRLHLQRSAREAAGTQLRGKLVVQLQRLEHVRRRVTPGGLAVGEPRVRADHGAVERRLAGRWNLDRDAQPIL